ncbi:MAG: hypothetical protein LBC98_09905 [Prevotellaceae bacterium]|jgi:hypothetical protein|nr:hypothetical protein [Prevotellaceae bacterium]
MKIFEYSEFTENIGKVFRAALLDEVIINDNEGNSYKLLPVNDKDKLEKSPFEGIKRIKLDITTQEIVELLRESRAD